MEFHRSGIAAGRDATDGEAAATADPGSGAARVRSPIFLVGSVRSGTTLLRLMLDHHPEVAFLHEFGYAVDLLKGDAWPAAHEFHRFLVADRIFQASGF